MTMGQACRTHRYANPDLPRALTEAQILEEFPYLEEADFQSGLRVLRFDPG